uniref:BTB domain-containing protein n=1 Tax=Globodera rostochiensis TaxID=31243 RepID=A0A914GSP9_GLORO
MITDLTIQNACTAKCNDVYLCQHINSQFSYRTAFASLKFKIVNNFRRLQITAIASQPTNASGPLAQIVSWKWDGGTQKIEETVTLNRDKTVEIDCYSSTSIVIRILKNREVIENPCPPFSSPDDDLTVHIGDRQVTVSASWLMVVSPVVKRMLSVEMKEKQQRTLNLDATNVLVLLKLADYFQIDWLKERCEAHLINYVEIPLIERFLLIERYRLNNLKNFFLRCLNVVNLREFLKANHEQQLLSAGFISNEFWFELSMRLCDKQ